MSDNPSPLEDLLRYLRDCSDGSVGSYMVKQLEMAAELRKQMRKELDLLISFEVNARFADALLHNAAALRDAADMRQKVFRFDETLPDRSEPDTARERIPARRGRPAARYRTKDVA